MFQKVMLCEQMPVIIFTRFMAGSITYVNYIWYTMFIKKKNNNNVTIIERYRQPLGLMCPYARLLSLKSKVL